MIIVYVLKSISENYHYIGHTKDLKNRLKLHNDGRVRTSKSHRPYKLIYKENFADTGEAIRRERFLKRGEGNIWLRNKLMKSNLW